MTALLQEARVGGHTVRLHRLAGSYRVETRNTDGVIVEAWSATLPGWGPALLAFETAVAVADAAAADWYWAIRREVRTRVYQTVKGRIGLGTRRPSPNSTRPQSTCFSA